MLRPYADIRHFAKYLLREDLENQRTGYQLDRAIAIPASIMLVTMLEL